MTTTMYSTSRRGWLAIALTLLAAIAALIAAGPAMRAQAAGEGTIAFTSATYMASEGQGTNVFVKLRRTGGNNGRMRVTLSRTIAPAASLAQDHTNEITNTPVIEFVPANCPTVPCELSIDPAGIGFGITILNDAADTGTDVITYTIESIELIDTAGDVVPAGLAATAGALSSATLTIVDDDGPPVFSLPAATASVAEGVGTASFAVTRGGSSAGTDTVTCTRTPGTAQAGDVTGTAVQVLSFGPGETTKFCTFGVVQDLAPDPGETVVLSLSAASTGTSIDPALDVLTVTILDDDVPSFAFSALTYQVGESAGTLTVTVTRSGAIGQAVSVKYNTTSVGGTATADTDYTAIAATTLNFGTNELSKTFAVTILNDNPAPEATETLLVQLSNASNSGTIGADSTVQIMDDDGAGSIQFSTGTFSVAEGAGSIAITVTRTGSTVGGVSVSYDTADLTAVAPGDYTAAAGTFFLAAGESVGSFTITIINDEVPEGNETFAARITAVSGGAGTVTGIPIIVNVTITNDDGGPTITSLNPNSGTLAGGTSVVIAGIGFTGVTGAAGVKFGGVNATSYVVDSDIQITAVSPAQAGGTVRVSITGSGGTSLDTEADDFTYTSGPTITLLAPSSRPSGSPGFVTITGSGFLGATKVTFAGLEVNFGVDSAIQITAAAPGNVPPGIVDVRVEGPGGISPIGPAAKFTYTGTALPPTVTSISPTGVGLNLTVLVTVNGTQFSAASTVKFGDVAGTNLTVVNPMKITVTAPASAVAKVVDVVVTTAGGSSAAGGTQNDFVYGTSADGPTVVMLLFAKWSLLTWQGKNGNTASQAMSGLETPTDNPATNNISGRLTAIYRWSPNGVGCSGGQLECWLAWFPDGANIPGANNFTTLQTGTVYWFAINGTGSLAWTVLQGP